MTKKNNYNQFSEPEAEEVLDPDDVEIASLTTEENILLVLRKGRAENKAIITPVAKPTNQSKTKKIDVIPLNRVIEKKKLFRPISREQQIGM
jgi:hypothetical protein